MLTARDLTANATVCCAGRRDGGGRRDAVAGRRVRTREPGIRNARMRAICGPRAPGQSPDNEEGSNIQDLI